MGALEILKYVHHLVVVTALATIFILWVQPAGADEIRLSGEELKREFTNKCHTGRSPQQGAKFTSCKGADGKATLKWEVAGRSGRDKGTWHIKDDMLCGRWKEMRDGVEWCSVIKRSGDILKSYTTKGKLRVRYTKVTDYK